MKKELTIQDILKEARSMFKEGAKAYKEHCSFDSNEGDEQWDEGYMRACEEIINFIKINNK